MLDEQIKKMYQQIKRQINRSEERYQKPDQHIKQEMN